MKNIDKGLKVQKWVLMNWSTIPQRPQNLSTPAQKYFDKEKSVVRA